MIDVSLSNSGPALSRDELARFAAEESLNLPPDYATLMLRANGGVIGDGECGFSLSGAFLRVPSLMQLSNSRDTGLRRHIDELVELGLGSLLPISSTLNGDYICISDDGRIVLLIWKRRNDVAVGADIVPVAGSFQDFVAMIHSPPAVEDELRSIAEAGNADDFESFLAGGGDPNDVDKNGDPLACKAAKFGNRLIVEACIQHGADLGEALHAAVRNSDIEMVRLLLDAGVDVDRKCKRGLTAIECVPGKALPEIGAVNQQIEDAILAEIDERNRREGTGT